MAVSPEEEARYLSEVDVLEPLSREVVDDLARELPDISLEAGEFLSPPQERSEEFFVLKKGRMRVYRTDPEGGELTLEIIEEGTVFGEMAFGGPRRLREAHARAVEPSLVASLRWSELEDLVRRNPEVGLRLVRLLSERLRLCRNRMTDFASKDVAGRLASLILYLVEGEGVVTGEGYRIPARYTHEQLGAMIGAQRVAVSRAFARLRESGAVEQRNRLIHVADMEALERAAGAEP